MNESEQFDNSLAVIEPGRLISGSAAMEMTREDFRQFMAEHLKPGKNGKGDFGLIDGCGDSLVLFKSGAEKTLAALETSYTNELQKEIINSDKGEYYYRYRCTVTTSDGKYLASSEGVCTSLESKYYYTTVRDITKFKDLASQLETGEIIKVTDGYGKATFLVANRKIHDKANTACRIAQKRALVGAALAALGIASEFFTLDLEDLMDYIRDESDEKSEKTAPAENKKQTKETKKVQPEREMSPVNPELPDEIEKENAKRNYNLICDYIIQAGYTGDDLKAVLPERLVGIDPNQWDVDSLKEMKQKLVLFYRKRAFEEIKQRDVEYNIPASEFAQFKIRGIHDLLIKTRNEFPL